MTRPPSTVASDRSHLIGERRGAAVEAPLSQMLEQTLWKRPHDPSWSRESPPAPSPAFLSPLTLTLAISSPITLSPTVSSPLTLSLSKGEQLLRAAQQ